MPRVRVRYSLGMRPFASISLLVALGVGCAANSDRSFRDREVAIDSPLARLVIAERNHEVVDDATMRDGLFQLEDLVEAAASRVAGFDVDYPSPELGDFDVVVEIDRRGTNEYEEWFHAALYPEDVGYGAKYLFDHAGIERGFDAIDHPRAGELAALVDEFVLGESTREEIEPELRAVEAAIRADLGISEEEWFGNELRYDAAVDFLGAFTEPAVGCPLFPRARIEIPRSMLGGSLLELIHTYGHELLHCMAGEFESAGEEHRIIEETSCEVFGAMVLREVLLSDRLGREFREAIAEAEGLDLAAFSSSAARSSEEDLEEPPYADEGEADAAETPPDFDLEISRLRALYRHSEVEFVAWRKTTTRYGYDDPLPGDDDDVAEQIEIVLESMTIRDFAALMSELSSLTKLRDLARFASTRGTVSIEEARGILHLDSSIPARESTGAARR